MSKRLFVKKFITANKETWAICPSSKYLAKKMVKKEDIINNDIIIEFWAWTWIFTKYIFEYAKNNLKNKKIFIIEKDIDFYNLLLKKFPDYKRFIYNIDVLDIEKLLNKYNIKKIDLLISWLPFKSLPFEIFNYLTKKFFPKFFDKNTKFVQFSYFQSFLKNIDKYFDNVDCNKCMLNFPIAYVFECTNIKKNENK